MPPKWVNGAGEGGAGGGGGHVFLVTSTPASSSFGKEPRLATLGTWDEGKPDVDSPPHVEECAPPPPPQAPGGWFSWAWV